MHPFFRDAGASSAEPATVRSSASGSRSRFRFGLALGFALGVVSLPEEAFGYCRAHSCQDDLRTGKMCERDEDDCIVEGNQLFYSSPCLSFAVAKGQAQSVGLSDRDFEELVEEAFERWSSVDCGGGEGPGFDIQSAGIVDVEVPYYCPVASLNLSVWLLNEMWEHPPSVLGYTTSTYAEDNAEVFDADVELNLERVLDELSGDNMTREVLLSIITHEAGHFLGLAHSNDAEAVMAASYSPRDLVGRALTDDDIDGICAIFPPEDGPKQCSEPGVVQAAIDPEACAEALEPDPESGCAVQASGSGAGAGRTSAGMLLILAGVFLRRRLANR